MYTVDRKLGLSQCTNVINKARGSGSMGSWLTVLVNF